MTLSPGPYGNEDGDWWVPVEAIPNRMKAAAEVRSVVDHDFRIRYTGREMARLDTEHEPCSVNDDGTEPECIVHTMCWAFETYEP